MISLLASGGLLQDLGINPVVLATQVVIFVITFLLLSRLLFGRALEHMQRREEEIQKAREAIQQVRTQVERMTKEYEAHLAKIDKEGYDKTQALLKDALATAQGAIAKAQADAKSESERAIAEIAREKKASLVQLRSDVTQLTLEVAEKVMETRLDSGARALVQKYIQERS
ncbi:MAG TPA: ATP synthase F0 subunit B [Planctomycetota bacterium]|nr:ATP synthase F0 subunit B [Planctomycetota bacterium]